MFAGFERGRSLLGVGKYLVENCGKCLGGHRKVKLRNESTNNLFRWSCCSSAHPAWRPRVETASGRDLSADRRANPVGATGTQSALPEPEGAGDKENDDDSADHPNDSVHCLGPFSNCARDATRLRRCMCSERLGNYAFATDAFALRANEILREPPTTRARESAVAMTLTRE